MGKIKQRMLQDLVLDLWDQEKGARREEVEGTPGRSLALSREGRAGRNLGTEHPGLTHPLSFGSPIGVLHWLQSKEAIDAAHARNVLASQAPTKVEKLQRDSEEINRKYPTCTV